MAHVLITSPDALIDPRTDRWYDGLEQALKFFQSQNPDNLVIVLSRSNEKLKDVPDTYNPVQLPGKVRGSGKVIDALLKQFPNLSERDIFILGANDADMVTAFNGRVLLLTAAYAPTDSRIHSPGYGIKISSPEKVEEFFRYFLQITDPWYYQIEIDEQATLYTLTNANTFGRGSDVVKLNEAFRECLKEGAEDYHNTFMVYALMSMQSEQTIDIFRGVDAWGVYPSSSTGPNPILEQFKELFRINYGSRFKQPILLRKSDTLPRHRQKKDTRVAIGCDNQLETIIVNPKAKAKVNGKTVCIIDDFTTYGTSCETTRILLTEAGAEKIIFVTMGKYGREYYRYSYQIQGNVFGQFEYARTGDYEEIGNNGIFNQGATTDIRQAIGPLLA
ncbi:phosphoribosyltransferase [Tunicatimonas pelagia]|uniref:phosphoribosyltransferase n=1 Tax=Tunicatimonas pelagia TaxID=931531 RepID=UPI002665903F|nr:phosphoribosyltransferase [Tunicatimonas pelagia]WKN46432.1 phosphoribosyltransferase [Tunicatimonas pelagia]